ncbi:hypothetical protein ACIBF1_34630 [Spirillospora sp. NPDC050679]
MTMDGRRPPLPAPRPPLWRRRWFAALAAVAALVLVVALVWGYDAFVREPACGDRNLSEVEITYRGERRAECVGVTDAHGLGDPRYAKVAEVMRAENAFAEAAGEGGYVTVAYLGPLTHPDPRVLHRLEGAVTAQHRANRKNLVGERPRVRLVLANTGSDASRWPRVADELLEMRDGPDNLRAVSGVGLSQEQTRQAARRLSGLAMVGDVVTADVLNREESDGLARVNPTVDGEIAVLARHLREKTKIRRATLVSSDDRTDLYTGALSESFKKHMGDLWKAGGSYDDPFGRNAGNQFNTIINNICSSKPMADMVFFAGRAADLPKFVDYLGNRRCHPEPLTVVTGSDAVLLTVDTPDTRQARRALAAGHNAVSLVYSPLAEPSLLSDPRNPEAPLYEAFRKDFEALGFAPGHLAAGWAITAHDATLTAAGAIRRAVSESGGVPTVEEVRRQLYLTRAASAVSGATGKIEIDSATGDRVFAELPVLRFVPDRAPEFLGVHPPR